MRSFTCGINEHIFILGHRHWMECRQHPNLKMDMDGWIFSNSVSNFHSNLLTNTNPIPLAHNATTDTMAIPSLCLPTLPASHTCHSIHLTSHSHSRVTPLPFHLSLPTLPVSHTCHSIHLTSHFPSRVTPLPFHHSLPTLPLSCTGLPFHLSHSPLSPLATPAIPFISLPTSYCTSQATPVIPFISFSTLPPEQHLSFHSSHFPLSLPSHTCHGGKYPDGFLHIEVHILHAAGVTQRTVRAVLGSKPLAIRELDGSSEVLRVVCKRQAMQ